MYPLWFYIPSGVLYVVLFAVPTFASFYFSLTRWTLFDTTFIGFDNFVTFFTEPMLYQSLINTFIYGFLTSALKVVLGLLLAVLLTGAILGRGYLRATIFFPVLVSTIGIGITFKVADGSVRRPHQQDARDVRHPRPGVADQPRAGALLRRRSSTSGRASASRRSSTSRASSRSRRSTTRPRRSTAPGRGRTSGTSRCRSSARHGDRHPAVAHRRAPLVRAHLGDDRGGPGFSSDVVASVIYKQYQAGFYGLSTAGNVILFLVVTAIVVPIQYSSPAGRWNHDPHRTLTTADANGSGHPRRTAGP